MAGTSSDRVLRPDHGRFDPRANALRALAFDAVQRAASGHPGAPMGMAEMAVALWAPAAAGGAAALKHNPADPHWPDRDRFVLSNGHASMLLYALLYLTGYELPIGELQRFRQLHSRTPGHPEVGITPGVETTTGPLGQGLANAVGMALAEKLLAERFNRPGHTVVDHRTWAFLGDGCLMEGISHEACSLAGVWGLDRLVALYDDNGISIDGAVEGWFRDDTAARFAAYGWNVIGPVDGHDIEALTAAIAEARKGRGRPQLIVCRTTIGRGSPARAGTAKAHGEPLGADELAAEFERRMNGELPADWKAIRTALLAEHGSGQSADALATRKASQKVLALLAPRLPEMLGGSADLTGSNLTDFPGCGSLRVGIDGGANGGRHVNYGVREFGMAAVMNGLELHGGFVPYGGTFLTFSDYSRNAIRMAALMKQRVIHVFTHDSIGLGEDGPTHQAVEHAASLRLIPNLDVWRPCDLAETAVAWAEALEAGTRPSALVLSRQNLPAQARSEAQVAQITRGGYVLSDRAGARAVILATGSEVALAMQAQTLLDERGLAVRVVSLPSTTVFDRQSDAWRAEVLGHDLPRFGVEAGVSRWWGQYGCRAALGVDSFGESAPAPEVFRHFGLTAAALAELVQSQIAG